jgi:ABC-2 type transport system permease protein
MVQMQNAASLGDAEAVAMQGSLAVTSAICLAMIFSLYCTLLAALVSRRESLVLKRLRSGELRDAEIIAGTAVPALVLSLGQLVGTWAAAALLWELRLPKNAVLVSIAIILGFSTFTALAAVTAVWTRTVELAQLTAVPLMMASLVCSGLMFPVSRLPTAVEPVANSLPLTSVVDLLRLGLSGQTRDGRVVQFGTSLSEAGQPLLILGVWTVISVWAARRWFRWEPRR